MPDCSVTCHHQANVAQSYQNPLYTNNLNKSKKNFISNNRWPTIEDIEDEEELEEDPEPMDEDDFSRRMASYPHSGPLHVSFVTCMSSKSKLVTACNQKSKDSRHNIFVTNVTNDITNVDA